MYALFIHPCVEINSYQLPKSIFHCNPMFVSKVHYSVCVCVCVCVCVISMGRGMLQHMSVCVCMLCACVCVWFGGPGEEDHDHIKCVTADNFGLLIRICWYDQSLGLSQTHSRDSGLPGCERDERTCCLTESGGAGLLLPSASLTSLWKPQ